MIAFDEMAELIEDAIVDAATRSHDGYRTEVDGAPHRAVAPLYAHSDGPEFGLGRHSGEA